VRVCLRAAVRANNLKRKNRRSFTILFIHA
jgi:hypothetical protein